MWFKLLVFRFSQKPLNKHRWDLVIYALFGERLGGLGRSDGPDRNILVNIGSKWRSEFLELFRFWLFALWSHIYLYSIFALLLNTWLWRIQLAAKEIFQFFVIEVFFIICVSINVITTCNSIVFCQMSFSYRTLDSSIASCIYEPEFNKNVCKIYSYILLLC